MYILIDIGGTKTRIVGSRDLETFGEPVIFGTPQKYEDGLATIVARAKEIAGTDHVDAVSLGVPGVIAVDRQGLVTQGNIPDWKGKLLGKDIGTALGGQVHMENDTALCGLGEAVFGAGRGTETIMYLTVSTGVGGARIVRGLIDSPERGAEVGYQYLTYGDPLERFSDLISGRAITKKYGMYPRDLGKEHPVWEELARITAIGVHNSILHWTPNRVVLGGSMFNEIGIPVESVHEYLKKIMRALPETPEVVHAQLGDVGGIWGGLARLKQLKA